MYGTVAKMKVKPGAGDLLAEFDKQMKDDRPPGMVGVWVYKMDADPDEIFMAVAFQSKEAYWANASSPEQDKRFRRMRELLAADPEWHDGEIINPDAS